MVKIRLMRIGAKKKPFYRVVAVDERLKRTGAYLELLGTYNPLTTPHEIKLKQDRIDAWIKQGAQMSDGFLRIIGKAPQKPPRKPKKAQPEPKAAPIETSAETATEPATETSTEETTTEVPSTEQPTEETAKEASSEDTSSENESGMDDSAEPTTSTDADTSESFKKE